MSQASKRGWRRFSLRAMLIVVTFVAVSLGLWAQRARNQRAGVAWVHEQGGHITYNFGSVFEDGRPYPNTKLSGPKWLRDLLGIDYLATVTAVILDRDEIHDLTPLTNLPRLETVGLMIEVHPNTDLSPLHSLKHLRLLRLDYTGLELAQLQPLRAALPNCRIESATNRELNASPRSP
jgi:hypothetical protein